MKTIAITGLDIAKQVIPIYGADQSGVQYCVESCVEARSFNLLRAITMRVACPEICTG